MNAEIREGDRIEVRDASGNWHPAIARSGVFLNVDDAPYRVPPWLVVKVDHDGFGHPVNWPAADVRLFSEDREG